MAVVQWPPSLQAYNDSSLRKMNGFRGQIGVGGHFVKWEVMEVYI